MQDEQQLIDWFEREQAHPRQSVVGALDSLGLRAGDRIADIGCGPGVHLRQMAARVAPGGIVTGIDTSTDRLAVAETMLRAEVEAGQVRLLKGDLHDLSSFTDTFDLAWMSLVLHHEEIPVDVVRDLRQIVKPGGRIAILDGDDLASFPLVPWPPELEMTLRQAVVDAAAANAGQGRLNRRYTARNLPSILGAAGLVDIEVRAFADLRQAPLDDWDRTDIESWFLNSFGARLRPYLSADDLAAYEASFTPGHPDCLLDQPGFFISRTWFLGVGTVR